jgi:hypothetical protein
LRCKGKSHHQEVLWEEKMHQACVEITYLECSKTCAKVLREAILFCFFICLLRAPKHSVLSVIFRILYASILELCSLIGICYFLVKEFQIVV